MIGIHDLEPEPLFLRLLVLKSAGSLQFLRRIMFSCESRIPESLVIVCLPLRRRLRAGLLEHFSSLFLVFPFVRELHNRFKRCVTVST